MILEQNYSAHDRKQDSAHLNMLEIFNNELIVYSYWFLNQYLNQYCEADQEIN